MAQRSDPPIRSANLGSLAAVLRRLEVRADAVDDPEPYSSACGCPLPEGCRGRGGWHLLTHTAESLRDMYGGHFVEDLRKGDASLSKVDAWRKWIEWCEQEEAAGRMDADGLHQSWKTYVGTERAFEPCQAYRAKVASGIAGERAFKYNTTGGRKPFAG